MTRARRIIAAREAEQLGLPVDIDPAEALVEAVQVAAGRWRWYAELVADAVSSHGPAVVAGGTVGVWRELEAAERDRMVAASAAALRAGVEERRVRLAEGQAAGIVAVIRAVLAELGVSVEGDVPSLVARELRALPERSAS